MDAECFERIRRSLPHAPSRRVALRAVAGAVLGGALAPVLAPGASDAGKKGGKKTKKCKGKKKVTICHHGQTMQVSACALKGHQKHGDPVGACASPPPPDPVTIACAGPVTIIFGGNDRFAQTFTAPRAGQVTAAQVELSEADAGNDYTLDIRTLDGTGKPTGTVLGSVWINDVAAGAQTLTGNFASPIAVGGGAGYALAVTAAPGQDLKIRALNDNTDCDGQVFVDRFADHTFLDTDGEMIFSLTIV
jgi:hypothetical protein